MQTDLPNINVLADPSLSVALSQIARQFSSKHGMAITTSYAPASAQSERITVGLEADLFITARAQTLDTLQTQGLIDVYSKRVISKNRLSLVTYAQNTLQLILIPKLPLASVLARIDPDFTFTIGDPNFQTAGFYALKALRNYEMADELEPNFLFVRSIVDMHRTMEAPGGYGLMYASEAKRNPSLKLLGTFPEVAHSPIEYVGAVVAGEHMDAARRFLDYLGSVEAQTIFAKHGFEALDSYESESGHLARGSAFKEPINPL